MQINEVIEQHGMQLREVSRGLGMKPSALQSAIDRNLTVKTLRLIANAAGIPIAEFFLDELTEDERKGLLAALQAPQAEAQPAEEQQEMQSELEKLAFGQQEQKQETVPGVVVCPHCKGHFVAEITFKATE